MGRTRIDIMRRIKRALDPRGILNPGKTVPGAVSRAFWQRLVLWREVLKENMLPALVAPIVWMTLVSFVLRLPFLRPLAVWAVGPLGSLVSGAAAFVWVTIGRRVDLTVPRAALLAVATLIVGAVACRLALPLYAARLPGVAGPVDLAAIGAIGAAFTAGLYQLRARRFRRLAADGPSH